MLEKKAVGVCGSMRTDSGVQREGNLFLEAVANLSAIALDNARLHKTLPDPL